MSEKIEVENVNVPGHTGRVDKVKYEAMRKALLSVLPEESPGLTHKEMIAALTPKLPESLWPGGAKVGWWSKTVQLDLEAKRLITRDPQAKPMRWYRAG
ncbi:MAG: hypothetical protein AAFX76_06125 [Planctomycetota bacterium]